MSEPTKPEREDAAEAASADESAAAPGADRDADAGAGASPEEEEHDGPAPPEADPVPAAVEPGAAGTAADAAAEDDLGDERAEPAAAPSAADARARPWTRDALPGERVPLSRDARRQQPERTLDLIDRGYREGALCVPMFHDADSPPRPAIMDRAWLQAELRRVHNALHDLQSVIDLAPGIVAPGLLCLLSRAIEAVLVVEGVPRQTTPDGLTLPAEAPGAADAVRREELALLLQVAGLARKARALDAAFDRADRRHLSELLSASLRALTRLRKRARGAAGEARLSPRVLAVVGGAVVAVALVLVVIGWYVSRGVGLEPVAAVDKPPGRVGGIAGSYFSQRDLSGTSKPRVDRGLSFHWRDTPMPGMPKDNFSVQWKGFVRFDERGSYRICTDSDDGVRLLLGDIKVLEDWSAHAKKRDCAEVYATKAGWYALKLEYFEQHGEGHIALLRGKSDEKEKPIPAGHLCCQDR